MRIVDKFLANMSKEEIGDLLIKIDKDLDGGQFGYGEDGKLHYCMGTKCSCCHYIEDLEAKATLLEEERHLIEALINFSNCELVYIRKMEHHINFYDADKGYINSIPMSESAFMALERNIYYKIDELLVE